MSIVPHITVLKFGSSVLRSEADLSAAVHEIYRWVRKGHRVVAVVSALGRSTDALLKQARSYGPGVSDRSVAALLATGEATSAALLALTLDRAGIPAAVLDEVQLGLQTSGAVLDSEPCGLNVAGMKKALQTASVLAVPGFVGRQRDGSISLLGRGGSDLTAVYIAHQLGAGCRLVKDVDGICEYDPAGAAVAPRRYRTLAYEDARGIDARVVQQKAIDFAAHCGQRIEIASLNSSRATTIGPEPSSFYGENLAFPPLRVGLLGAGVVGLGVYRTLAAHPEAFEITGIGVRRTQRDDGTPQELLTSDPWQVLKGDCQLVIELIGGVSPAYELIHAALNAGRHVITANKLVIARHGSQLRKIAAERGVALHYSAAVGGGVPMLEQVRRIGRTCRIETLQGVVNGTTNFILDRIAEGSSREEALREAQRLGFAEQDPTTDLDGSDAAHKIALLAHTAFGTWIAPQNIQKNGIQTIDEGAVREAAKEGRAVRLVASVSNGSRGVRAQVGPEFIDGDHAFAQVHNENNCLEIKTDHGVVNVRGKGAGRWPTTESVIADVLDLQRSRQTAEPVRA